MKEFSFDWKTYLKTGATATLAVALAHTTSNVANASCSEHWTTLGVAGAVGSMLGAYQAKGGSVVDVAKGWKNWTIEKLRLRRS